MMRRTKIDGKNVNDSFDIFGTKLGSIVEQQQLTVRPSLNINSRHKISPKNQDILMNRKS